MEGKMKKPVKNTAKMAKIPPLMVKYDSINDRTAEKVLNHLGKGGVVNVIQSAAWSPNYDPTIKNSPTSYVIPQAFYGYQARSKEESKWDRATINATAWDKYIKDAFVRTSIERIVGRITGEGFQFYSENWKINRWIDRIVYDVRNELYSSISGFVTRKLVESELFLKLTVHEDDGFVEVDIIEPGMVEDIIAHKRKNNLPLFFKVRTDPKEAAKGSGYVFYPSVYVGYLPKLALEYDQTKGFDPKDVEQNPDVKKKSRNKLLYRSYVLNWRFGVKEMDRYVSSLRTVFEPIEDYKEAKEWRFEYMKAISSFFIFYQFEDQKTWVRWLALPEEKKKETGLAQPLRPADRLFCPPGVKPLLLNPNLPRLSGEDEDFLKWISGGLRQPYDITSSDIKGPTYASVKGSRTPYLDFISDVRDMARNFFINDFWKFIFFTKGCFDRYFVDMTVREAVEFKAKKPKFRDVVKRPESLIKVSFPMSAEVDMLNVANASLGSKRGSLTYHLGTPKSLTADKLGIGDYHNQLLYRATEEERYPEEYVKVDENVEGNAGAQPQDKKSTEPKPKPQE